MGNFERGVTSKNYNKEVNKLVSARSNNEIQGMLQQIIASNSRTSVLRRSTKPLYKLTELRV